MLEHEEITGRIIGAALAVHRSLGPGFLESIYEQALAIEFAKRGIRFSQQHEVDIKYDAHPVGKHRLDFFIEGEIVVELKTVRDIADEHFVAVRSYLKALEKRHGLIINFSKPTLDVKRVIR